VEKQDRKLQ